MSFPYDKMRAFVAGGLSIVCATCARFWEGRDAQLPEPQCTAVGPCCGPLGGGAFGLYDGPITEFGRWCFRCGADSTVGVRVAGSERVFGVCSACSDHVVRLSPADGTPRPILEVLQPQGLVIVQAVPSAARPSPRKNLLSLLRDAEAELAARAERRGT